jgi:hypothetical protein
MFSEEHKKSIEKRIRQLTEIENGMSSPEKLSDFITQIRVSWFERNRNMLLQKYEGLPEVEKAYNIIFIENMGIPAKDSKVVKINNNKIMIESRNFCPYLEACKILGLDTRYVCKVIVEPSIQKVCKAINSKLDFNRNYERLRPHIDFCEEYIELHADI